MNAKSEKPSVFLSYSARDVSAAQCVVRALSDAGFTVLQAADVLAGHDVAKAVREAMLESNALVVVTAPNTPDSPWTAFEIGAAMAWGKSIYVVTTDKGPLPAYLQQLHVLTLEDVPQLVQSLQREVEPLSHTEQAALSALYAQVGVAADKLIFNPDASARLVEEFNRRTRNNASADRLLRELLRLRKLGRLPRLHKMHNSKVGAKPVRFRSGVRNAG